MCGMFGKHHVRYVLYQLHALTKDSTTLHVRAEIDKLLVEFLQNVFISALCRSGFLARTRKNSLFRRSADTAPQERNRCQPRQCQKEGQNLPKCSRVKYNLIVIAGVNFESLSAAKIY